MCDISNLVGLPCGDNTPGTRGKFYAIPVSELTGWPAYLTTTAPGDSVKISAPFTFVTTVGKGYWRTVPVLTDKNSFTLSMVGGRGSKSVELKANYTVNGLNAAQLEHITMLKNVPCVFLVPDKSGVVHVIGTFDDPAYLESADGSTGAAAEDERNIAVVIRAVTSKPTVYTGTINLTPNP